MQSLVCTKFHICLQHLSHCITSGCLPAEHEIPPCTTLCNKLQHHAAQIEALRVLHQIVVSIHETLRHLTAVYGSTVQTATSLGHQLLATAGTKAKQDKKKKIRCQTELRSQTEDYTKQLAIVSCYRWHGCPLSFHNTLKIEAPHHAKATERFESCTW